MAGEAIPHHEDWQDHYPTETAYGHTYPTPEDWVFNNFEQGDLILSWKRYEDIGHDHTDDYGVVEARNFAKNAGTPDEEAMLAPGVDYEYHETEQGVRRPKHAERIPVGTTENKPPTLHISVVSLGVQVSP